MATKRKSNKSHSSSRSANHLKTLLLFVLAFGLVGLIVLIRSYAATGNVLTSKNFSAAGSENAQVVVETASSKKNSTVVQLTNGSFSRAEWNTSYEQTLAPGTYKVCMNGRVPFGSAEGKLVAYIGAPSTSTTTPYKEFTGKYFLQGSQSYSANNCVYGVVVSQATTIFRVVATNTGKNPVNVGSIIFTNTTY
jgi:cytoskeletal protein RodZ